MFDGKLTGLGAAYITKVTLTLALSFDCCAHTQDTSSFKRTEFMKREKKKGKGKRQRRVTILSTQGRPKILEWWPLMNCVSSNTTVVSFALKRRKIF